MYNPQTLENIWIFSTFKRNHETTLRDVEQKCICIVTIYTSIITPASKEDYRR